MDYEPIVRALPKIIIPSGKILCRCRINKPGELFYKKEDLYNPNGKYPPLGRANRPEQVVFYASFSDGTDGSPYPRITNLYETSDLSIDKSRSGKETITYSGWITNEELNLICLPVVSNLPFQTETSRLVDDLWQAAKCIHSEGLISDIEFISKKYTSDDPGDGSVYIISSAFANYVFEHNPEIDGILYPSVKMQGKGINVALRTDAPQRKLRLKKVTVCHLFKKLDQSLLLNRFECNVINPNHFSYKNHPTYNKREYLLANNSNQQLNCCD